MKLAVVLSLAAATVVLALPAGAASPNPGPKNASFESGFAGWTLSGPPGASATIVPGQVRQGGGTRYAQLEPLPANNPIAADQTFDGPAGGTVTGFARFNNAELNGECFFVDTALIEIDGNPVFEADSCTTGDTGGVVWTYVLTTTGSHTIHGEVQNGVDEINPSSLDMDAPMAVKLNP